MKGGKPPYNGYKNAIYPRFGFTGTTLKTAPRELSQFDVITLQ